MDFDVIEDEIEEEDEEDSDVFLLKRIGHVALKYGRYMLVWGGYQETNAVPGMSKYLPVTEVLLYEPVLEKWKCLQTGKADAPESTSGSCGLILNERLFIFGGYRSRRENTSRIYSLDLETLRWHRYRVRGPTPLACDKMVGWVHEGRLYYFGGFGMPPPFNMNRRCAFVCDEINEACQRGWNNQLVMFDPETEEWSWPTCRGLPPIPRAAHAAAKINNKVYIFGGRHDKIRMNDLHFLDLVNMTWSGRLEMKGEIPKGRSWHSFTAISDSCIALYGGFTQSQEALSECWLLNVTDLTWTRVETSSGPRLWHTACIGDPGELIIFGGCVGNILSPRFPIQAEDIITLWFSPKSLLRLCLDANLRYKQQLKPSWETLPLTLHELLIGKSENPERSQS